MQIAFFFLHSITFFICDLSGCTIFFPHLINNTIFREKLLNLKCVFWLSLQLLSATFLIIRRIGRDIIINVYWSSCNVPFYSCHISFKTEISRQIFEKYSDIKFHENLSSGKPNCLHADTQTDMTKPIVACDSSSQFCEQAYSVWNGVLKAKRLSKQCPLISAHIWSAVVIAVIWGHLTLRHLTTFYYVILISTVLSHCCRRYSTTTQNFSTITTVKI